MVKTRLHLFDQKYTKSSTTATYYYNLKYLFLFKHFFSFLNVIYSCGGKAEFSVTPVFRA